MSESEEIVDTEAWDRQIEADSDAGRLDALTEESVAEHEAGKSRAPPGSAEAPGVARSERRKILDDMTREAHQQGLNWD